MTYKKYLEDYNVLVWDIKFTEAYLRDVSKDIELRNQFEDLLKRNKEELEALIKNHPEHQI